MAVERTGKDTAVLARNQFFYLRNRTDTGIVKTVVGPAVADPNQQEEPIVWDATTRTFRSAALLEAIQTFPEARKGAYVRLLNPAVDGKQPGRGSTNEPDLLVGREVNIHGPWSQALHPGQSAEVIPGHLLQRNQFVLVEVTDEEALRKAWADVVFKKVDAKDGEQSGERNILTELADLTGEEVTDVAEGRRFVIPGTKVSFFMPPTGMRVVSDDTKTDRSRYVRDANTLESQEYAILADQSGQKDYRYGPMVAFPRPTAKFQEYKGSKVFRMPEVNKLQGIYVAVVAPFVDEGGDYGDEGVAYEAGQELFITGSSETKTRIFRPRPELHLVTYNGVSKHFATAIPKGDGRYVMKRHEGDVVTVKGPKMLLPDPRTEVIARRVLTDKQCELWYPGNQAVLAFNRALRAVEQREPTTRAGVVSEESFLRSAGKGPTRTVQAATFSASLEASEDSSLRAMGVGATNQPIEAVGDSIERAGTYTQPRTVQLGESWGVPKIDIHVGYAICVTDTDGNRRVEVGPQRVLLAFNEVLQVLMLSTGKPKTTDTFYPTVFLQVGANKVSDIIAAETSDHVLVNVKVSMRLDFEGSTPDERMRWFAAENYVKLVCDHVRSVVKGALRKHTVEAFHAEAEDIVRSAILGAKVEGTPRTGMKFETIGARIVDVDVLGIELGNKQIAALLQSAQQRTVERALSLREASAQLDADKRTEVLERERASTLAETEAHAAALAADALERRMTTAAAEAQAEQARFGYQAQAAQAREAVADIGATAQLARELNEADQQLSIDGARQTLALAGLSAETTSIVDRFKAGQGTLADALLALRDASIQEKVAQALGPAAFIGGKTLPDVLQSIFGSDPLGKIFAQVGKGNGTNGHAVSAAAPA